MFAAFSQNSSATPIAINSPTTAWNAVFTQGGNQMDYAQDQQTGSTEGDITGDAQNAGFYTYFDNNGSASHTDGTMYFRIRLGRDQNPVGFKTGLFVGINIPSVDNALKLFVAVDNAGSGDGIKIFAAGAGANTSPSTTSMAAVAPQKVYAETASNYDWNIVNPTYDPVVTNLDTNNDGSTDYFLSFSLPFADVVSEMLRLSSLVITDQTIVRFVVATATQNNSLNQDLGGIPKTFNGASTWETLGGFTPASEIFPTITSVPEPATVLLTGLGISLFAWRRRRG